MLCGSKKSDECKWKTENFQHYNPKATYMPTCMGSCFYKTINIIN